MFFFKNKSCQFHTKSPIYVETPSFLTKISMEKCSVRKMASQRKFTPGTTLTWVQIISETILEKKIVVQINSFKDIS